MNPNTKECATCFLTDKFPGVVIGDDGVCNSCKKMDSDPKPAEVTVGNLDQLREIAEEIKRSRQGKYDCIIGASGGLDSSYVIYVAKKLLRLSPLIVHYDHGFVAEQADRNLANIARAFNVDIVSIKSKKNLDVLFVKHFISALEKTGIYWGMCTCCHYILKRVVDLHAAQYDLTWMLVSQNEVEQLRQLGRDFRPRKFLKAIFSGSPITLIERFYHLMMAYYYFTRFKIEFKEPLFRALTILRSEEKLHLKKVNITKYVKWDFDEMVKVLSAEANWSYPAGGLPMRFDCILEHSYVLITEKNALNIAPYGQIFNNLIHRKLKTKGELKGIAKYYESKIPEEIAEAQRRMKSVSQLVS